MSLIEAIPCKNAGSELEYANNLLYLGIIIIVIIIIIIIIITIIIIVCRAADKLSQGLK